MTPAARILFLLLLLAASVHSSPREFDVILRRGTVIDGTGQRRYKADVAITNGRIARIGSLRDERAAVDLDADGLFIAPGFINLHSHASPEALPSAENMLTQGVTTEILNPDGGGPIDVAEQLSRLRSGGLALNVGAYIGFNSIWRTVVGPADRRPAADEIERMRTLLAAGLEHGAWGVSAGLDYKPAYFATTDEVVKIVEAARPWRTHFTNHDRVTPESNFSSRAGIQETIAIGEHAGLVPVITHMKAQGREQGTAGALVGLMRQATARGHYTAADVYPYLAGQTGLGALLIPAWAQDGGGEAQQKRFADPVLRARIVAETEQAMDARFGGPQGVYVLTPGRELVDVMRELQVSAGEAVVRLLEQGAGGAILRFGMEGDLLTLFKYPDTAIACDCGATTSTRTHPRNYGTFPRVLGQYVRVTGTLTWEAAVRKMTGLPASIVGMVDRGFLAPGMAADVTVFDPATVIDRATYESPAELSAGIRHVLVNGRLALRDGKVTGDRAGVPLVRAIHMPSRPLGTTAARRASVRGTVVATPTNSPETPAPVRISFDIAQGGDPSKASGSSREMSTGDRRHAKGSFRLQDRHAGLEIRMKDPGLLQVAGGWATFTGTARVLPADEDRSVTVIVDEAGSPASQPASIIVEIEGVYRFRGTLPPGVLTVR